MYQDFTSSEQKIGNYILENYKEVTSLSVKDFAAKTNTSPASIVRFAKKLGYNGFTELKIELASSRLEDKGDDITNIIRADDKMEEMIKKVEFNSIETIKETVKLLNSKSISAAISEINKADTIYLFGVGASALVATDLQYKLLRINKKVIFQLDNNLQLATAVHIDSDDIALGISYSGSTREVNIGMAEAKKNGAKCISITSSGKNNLADIADINLYVPNIEKELRVGAISSRLSQLMLTDIIFLAVAKENFDQTEEYLKSTRNLIQQLKE